MTAIQAILISSVSDTAAYVLIAIGYEDRDLIRQFGHTYVEYMDKVPGILPFTMWR